MILRAYGPDDAVERLERRLATAKSNGAAYPIFFEA